MTPEQKKALFKQLSQPFPEEAMERTDGRQTGKGYSTTGIKAQFIINRLNEVLDIGGWRTHRKIDVRELTTNSGRKAYEAVCDLVLERGEWSDGTFVPFANALADGGHISMSEADARMGSGSVALVSRAAFFASAASCWMSAATPPPRWWTPSTASSATPASPRPPAAFRRSPCPSFRPRVAHR